MNNKKILIGILSNPQEGQKIFQNHEHQGNLVNLVQDNTQDLIDSVLECGAEPILLSADTSRVELLHNLQKVDGFIISFSRQKYLTADSNHFGDISSALLLSLQSILGLSNIYKKPILATGFGCNIINDILGGSSKNISSTESSDSECDIEHNMSLVRIAHTINIDIRSTLAYFVGYGYHGVLDVNSCHNKAIDVLAPSLKATSYSADKIIESYEIHNDDRFFIGTQFHPEALWKFIDIKWINLFKGFIFQCRNNQLQSTQHTQHNGQDHFLSSIR